MEVATGQEIEALRSNVQTAQISTNTEAMEIAVQMLQRQIEESIITSPIDGTITNIFTREGQMGGGLLFTIEDTDNLRIITRIREYDLPLITEGMPVTIIAEAINGNYEGRISRINPTAIPNSPIVEFEVDVEVVSQNTNLKIGMTTRIKLD